MDECGDLRVVLRPCASPLPLGVFSFAVGMALLGGLGLGWLSGPQDVRTAGVLMAAFVFPLEMLAAVVALLAEDSAIAATLGLYATSWLGLGLGNALDPTALTNRAAGLFLAAFALVLVPLAFVAALRQSLLGAVLSVSIVRAGLQAGYELGGPHWLHVADGGAALAVLALAVCAGTVFLVESSGATRTER